MSQQVFPFSIDDKTSCLAEQTGQSLGVVHAGEQGDGHAERGGQFGDFFQRSVVLVGICVEDEHGGIMVQGALDLCAGLDVKYMNFNSGITKQGIDMLSGFR